MKCNNSYLGISIISSLIIQSATAQGIDTLQQQQLPEVVVKAYEQGRRLQDVPAAISIINRQAFSRFAPFSVVAAINTAPGIRVEERSPGSYRINIRGSALRSPFGVRNVKIYLNDIPYTPPTGTTYLNQLGFYNFQSIEVIKGPGSSLYGAGTGGVMLIESMSENTEAGIQADYTFGAYQTHQAHAALTTKGVNSTNRISYQHQQSEGYRNHTAMQRDVLTWTGHHRLGDSGLLKTFFLYGNLSYETPGALTISEFRTNPRAARPGAENARAAIYQQTFVAGASIYQPLGRLLSNKTVLYGAATNLRNPNLRGFDRSLEPHTGGRTLFTLQPQIANFTLQLQAGAEVQTGFTTIRNAKNVAGRADSLRYTDEVRNTLALYFAQANFGWRSWLLTGGFSVNTLNLSYQRFAPQTSGEQTRRFENELAGRLALLRRIGAVSIYSSVSRGFSPPTLNELLPTGGVINTTLKPESGVNYDLGARAVVGRLAADVNLFLFSLDRTIVQRRDSLGGDFYLNSGKTKQKGAEASLQYRLSDNTAQNGLLWVSYTHHNFRYREFKQLANDFSGKQLPGVAPNILAAGADLRSGAFSLHLNYLYNDVTPLNDANTAKANAYHLLSTQLRFMQPWKNRNMLTLFIGADNLLNQRYSLGNDINAPVGRFYNAAPGRNYFAGITVRVKNNKEQQ